MSGLDGKNRWVCPNDRELTLRAKLDTGWCVKSGATNLSPTISDEEQKVILDVLRRAQQVEMMEKARIDRLVDRLNNMKRNAKGDGHRYCALCNDEFGLFGPTCHTCQDCNKAVCSKCGVDTQSTENEPLWLCKICSETREMWKKSGAWFLSALPKFSTTCQIQISDEGSSSQNSTPENSLHLSCYSKSSKAGSQSASPVLRRKSRSPSPRNYRYGVREGEKGGEFVATLDADRHSNDGCES